MHFDTTPTFGNSQDLTATRLAQWGECRSAEQRRKWCPCNDILDFLVFPDKDDEAEAPSHKSCSHITLWDLKEPTHYLKTI